MKHVLGLFVALTIVGIAATTVAAHEITFKGTVVSVEPGKVTKVTVNVVDEKTKKTTTTTFEIDDETKVFRGDVAVKIAEARIVKGESIAITVDHDESETLANIVKLPARK